MTTFVRRLRESVAIVTVACTVAVCAEVPAEGQEAELLELQNQWASARIAGDVAFLERLYAKEFWITSMNSSVVTREQDIGVFASREMKPETIVDEDMTVTVYDDFAIVAGREHVKGTYKGAVGDFAMRFTNVYVRRDGRWQLLTHHSTQVRN